MPDPTDIPYWLRVDDRITSSGQPDERQIAALRAIGVAHVVNLAPHTHVQALAGEREAVEAAGMTYVQIPVAFDAPTEADFARFRHVMQSTGEARVHVHCIVNARVSAFLYRYRRDILGVDDATARAPMDRLWQPGGVWAAFVGDKGSIALPHRGPRNGPDRQRG